MREMTVEEAKELIGELLDVLEKSIVLNGAYKVVATVEGMVGWEDRVQDAQNQLAPHFAEVFLPLREILLSSAPAHISYTDWHRIVQNLIESVGDLDADSDASA